MSAMFIVLLAPFVHGAMRSLRARLQGRPGPLPWQPYRDLRKLWSKRVVLPEGAWIARIVPGYVLGTALTFAAATPLLASVPFANADVVGIALLLASGRFALLAAGLETRSAFVGMAASREATFGALAEPTLVIALLGAIGDGHGARLSALPSGAFDLPRAAALTALFMVMLGETARVPIDNQETHYELTMIHEGLQLEYSGRHLAMLEAAAQIRQLCFLVLTAALLPGDIAMRAMWIVALAGGMTLVETLFAKLRLFEVPQLLASAFIVAASGAALHALGGSW